MTAVADWTQPTQSKAIDFSEFSQWTNMEGPSASGGKQMSFRSGSSCAISSSIEDFQDLDIAPLHADMDVNRS